MKPQLLDLFCGAGGAAKGYQRAGFYVVGVDNKPQPHYCGDEFYQADALEFPLKGYDAYHASPPCQAFSLASLVHRNRGKHYPDLIGPTRERLLSTGKVYVIENVQGAPLNNAVTLCGVTFGLGVFRHRCFESNYLLLVPRHIKHNGHIGDGKYFSVAGGAGRWKSWGRVFRNVSKGTAAEWREAMGIDWMTRAEIKEAIPPAYTEYIGGYLMKAI